MSKAKRKIRVGIVGLGTIFDLHARGYIGSNDCEICLLCDKRNAVAEKWARSFPGARTTADFGDLLKADLDLIEILTPYPLHADMTCAALRSGAHVSVQKPMALTLEEADRMIAAAKETGRHLRVFENFLFYPPLMKAKALLKEGSIGRPLNLRMHMVSGDSKFGWHVDEEAVRWPLDLSEQGLAGGVMAFDHGWHMLALAQWLFGEVRDVFARIDQTLMQNGFHMDAPATLTWRHVEPPVHATYDCTYAPEMFIRTDYYAGNEWVEITGERGIITISRISARPLEEPALSLYSNGEVRQFHNLNSDWGDSFGSSVKQFLKFLKGEDEEIVITGKEGRDVLEMALALQASSRLGRPVSIESAVNNSYTSGEVSGKTALR
jgi:predicted dehydrogenase